LLRETQQTPRFWNRLNGPPLTETGTPFLTGTPDAGLALIPRAGLAYTINAGPEHPMCFAPVPELVRNPIWNGVNLWCLPPYSPDCNPVKKTWANMKKELRNAAPLHGLIETAIYVLI
jgi:hypothetical protein